MEWKKQNKKSGNSVVSGRNFSVGSFSLVNKSEIDR